MSEIKYMQLVFKNRLQPYDIRHFRKAVSKVVGAESDLFHNHGEQGFIYRYPLIQYKTFHKRASIIALNEGTEVIHHLFQKGLEKVEFAQFENELEIESINAHKYNIQLWQDLMDYRIRNWFALNEENHNVYSALELLKDKIDFLEKTLTANILGFLKAMDYHAEEHVKVVITKMLGEKWVSFKDIKVLSFDFEFKSNVSIPPSVGIGKAASTGFGIISKIKGT